MTVERVTKKVGAYSLCGKSTDNHIGIKNHLHETASKTSSSVTKPALEACGVAARRNSSKLTSASCRRRASLAKSLLVRPAKSQALSRSISKLSSSRIVSIALMYDTVIQLQKVSRRFDSEKAPHDAHDGNNLILSAFFNTTSDRRALAGLGFAMRAAWLAGCIAAGGGDLLHSGMAPASGIAESRHHVTRRLRRSVSRDK